MLVPLLPLLLACQTPSPPVDMAPAAPSAQDDSEPDDPDDELPDGDADLVEEIGGRPVEELERARKKRRPKRPPAPATNADKPALVAPRRTVPPGTYTPWAPPQRGTRTGVFLGAQVFSGWVVSSSETGANLAHQFFLERAEVGGGFQFNRTFAGLVRLETYRAADGLMPRLRLAYGAFSPQVDAWGAPLHFDVRAGLVPEIWLESLEGRYGLRGLMALPSERLGLVNVSDLGVSAGVNLADGLVDIRAQFVNGEGHTALETGMPKNLSALVIVRPLSADVLDDRLEVGGQIGAREGGVGATGVADRRVQGALFASHGLFHLGAEANMAFGVNGDADRTVVLMGGWGDAAIVPGWLSVLARYDFLLGNVDGSDALGHDLVVGLFSDFGVQRAPVLRRMRLYTTFEARAVGAGAGPLPNLPPPGTELRGLVVLEATGLTDVFAPWRRR